MLFVIECDFLPSGNVPRCKETKSGQIRVQAVDPDIVDGQVGFARMVDKVCHVAVQGGVDGVQVFVPEVEVQVEQVSFALGVCKNENRTGENYK